MCMWGRDHAAWCSTKLFWCSGMQNSDKKDTRTFPCRHKQEMAKAAHGRGQTVVSQEEMKPHSPRHNKDKGAVSSHPTTDAQLNLMVTLAVGAWTLWNFWTPSKRLRLNEAAYKIKTFSQERTVLWYFCWAMCPEPHPTALTLNPSRGKRASEKLVAPAGHVNPFLLNQFSDCCFRGRNLTPDSLILDIIVNFLLKVWNVTNRPKHLSLWKHGWRLDRLGGKAERGGRLLQQVLLGFNMQNWQNSAGVTFELRPIQTRWDSQQNPSGSEHWQTKNAKLGLD